MILDTGTDKSSNKTPAILVGKVFEDQQNLKHKKYFHDTMIKIYANLATAVLLCIINSVCICCQCPCHGSMLDPISNININPRCHSGQEGNSATVLELRTQLFCILQSHCAPKHGALGISLCRKACVGALGA